MVYCCFTEWFWVTEQLATYCNRSISEFICMCENHRCRC